MKKILFVLATISLVVFSTTEIRLEEKIIEDISADEIILDKESDEELLVDEDVVGETVLEEEVAGDQIAEDENVKDNEEIVSVEEDLSVSKKITFHKNKGDGETRSFDYVLGEGRINGYHEYGGAPTSGSNWTQPWNIGGFSGLFGKSKFVAWNTKADASGTYFRGGAILTEEAYNTILAESDGNLYQVWAGVSEMRGLVSLPSITASINESDRHRNVQDALELSTLDDNVILKANIIPNEQQSLIIWGRLDKWGDHETSSSLTKSKGMYGHINISVDSRIEFSESNKLKFKFTSPWLMLDLEDHQYTQNGNVYETSFEYLTVDDSNPDVVKYRLPLKLANKNILAQMSLEEFQRPMTLEIKNSENDFSFVTASSYEEIAKSENQHIEVNFSMDMSVDVKDESKYTSVPNNDLNNKFFLKLIHTEQEEIPNEEETPKDKDIPKDNDKSKEEISNTKDNKTNKNLPNTGISNVNIQSTLILVIIGSLFVLSYNSIKKRKS